MNRGQLHLFVDRRCAHVQRTAEDEQEAEHVVDWFGVIRTAGITDNGVFAPAFASGSNFRLRVRQRQNRSARFTISGSVLSGLNNKAHRAVNPVLKRTLAVVFTAYAALVSAMFGSRSLNHAFGIATTMLCSPHPKRLYSYRRWPQPGRPVRVGDFSPPRAGRSRQQRC